jgi:streptomycin 6-kinase
VNVLESEREPWLAIDPKGVVGDRLYDVATFLNGLSRWRRAAQPRSILERQVNQMAEATGADREQILGWGLAQIVLAGWWHFEDHGHGWEPALALAALYAALLQRRPARRCHRTEHGQEP